MDYAFYPLVGQWLMIALKESLNWAPGTETEVSVQDHRLYFEPLVPY